MEPSGDAPELQSWRDYFLRLGQEPHSGQRELFEIAATEEPAELLAVMPTGYGKTYAGAGYYVIGRSRGFYNRLLWMVSSDAQRDGLCPPNPPSAPRRPSVSEEISGWFGTACSETYLADGTHASLRMHWENRAEIFVASYQQQGTQLGYLRELLDERNGQYRWLIVGDEAHRLSVEGKWGEYLAQLPRVATLFESATPVRADKRALRNVPQRTAPDGSASYEARVEVTWQSAIDEGAIRKPRAHAEEWQLIDVADRNGNPVTLTTTELAAAPKGDIDKYMTRRDLHFTSTYVSKIFMDACIRLNDKRAQWPGTHQMLVFALSCEHARFLASQFEPFVDADWIGVTRPDHENKAVLARYLRGNLSVLVQVNKAAEGFNNPPTSVLLFMNLIQADPTLLQQLGRGARRLWDIPKDSDVLDVFADTSHPVIEVVRQLQPAVEAYAEPGQTREAGTPGSEWDPIPDIHEIEAHWLSTQIVLPRGLPGFPSPVLAAARQFGMAPEDVCRLVNIVNGGEEPKPADEDARPGESAMKAFYDDRVKRAMKSLTSHVITLQLAALGRMTPDETKELAGTVKKNLNFRWVRDQRMNHGAMLSEDFKAKYQWLRQIDMIMKDTGRVPPWLLSR